MYTVAWKHKMDKNLSTYATNATTINHTFGHYDLGAGGRAVTTATTLPIRMRPVLILPGAHRVAMLAQDFRVFPSE
jgi:hypothetical protein